MEEKKLDALSRAQELLKADQFPDLAVDYAVTMAYMGRGTQEELMFKGLVHYAQIEEKLPCSDSLYIANEEEQQFYAEMKRKKVLSENQEKQQSNQPKQPAFVIHE